MRRRPMSPSALGEEENKNKFVNFHSQLPASSNKQNTQLGRPFMFRLIWKRPELLRLIRASRQMRFTMIGLRHALHDPRGPSLIGKWKSTSRKGLKI